MAALSKRLKLIASLVPRGTRVCDIGTDHGYLSIELAKFSKGVIAADINQKPLLTAKRNIEKSGTEGITLRLCDGLSGIDPKDAETVIIAGIGGEVISGILERGKDVAARKGVTLILQPTTSPEYLREFLVKNGYEIRRDVPIAENGKVYSVMVCFFTENASKHSPSFYYIGNVKYEGDGVAYLEKQYKRCLKNASALKMVPEKQEEYRYYKSICEDMEKLFKE